MARVRGGENTGYDPPRPATATAGFDPRRPRRMAGQAAACGAADKTLAARACPGETGGNPPMSGGPGDGRGLGGNRDTPARTRRTGPVAGHVRLRAAAP